METHVLLLLGLGALLAFIGGLMMLVAAFRQNIWWGVACLLLAPASLVFTILHWAKARKGFFVSLAGLGAIALGLATSPTLRNTLAQLRNFNPSKLQTGFASESNQPEPDLDVHILQRRERLQELEAKFAADGAALVQQFQQLTEQRKNLKAGDDATVNAFNVEVAKYQTRNTARQQAGQEIATLRAELDALLEQRSRRNAAAPAAGSKKVVMYSTANCPACKMAKSYLAKKGVSYEERDVNNSSEARAEFQKLGGRGVPLILVGTERMEGFSSQRLDQML